MTSEIQVANSAIFIMFPSLGDGNESEDSSRGEDNDDAESSDETE